MQDNNENQIFGAAGSVNQPEQAEPIEPEIITPGETQETQDADVQFQTSFEQNAEPVTEIPNKDLFDGDLFDGDKAFNAQKEWQARNDAAFNHISARFDLSNKRLKIALFSAIGVVIAAIIAIIVLFAIGQKQPVEPVEAPPPELEIQIIKPDAVGVKKSDGELKLADPGELNIGLSTPLYEPESPGVMSYFADIPCAVQLYHDLGAFTDLNKFQATASTYAALIRAELLESLPVFHDIRYTDYQDQNHPEQEFIGTNYSILSGTDFYQTHNYELLMDSDGCQSVTYSYIFNLKNSSRIEEYDFTDYLDCLRVLTGFDLSNNDILYLIRVSMNNYNQNGQSSVQVISNDDNRDYILFEQTAAADPGNYHFVITCRKNMDAIHAPDFNK